MKRPHVALIIEFSRGYARGILSGIGQYLQHHGPDGHWSVYCSERLMTESPPSWFNQWQGDGIIARVEGSEIEQAIIDKGLPAVDLRGKMNLGFPLIETDDKLVAELGAQHLIERGFQHFAYCGFSSARQAGGALANYSEIRKKYFLAAVHDAGFPCEVYLPEMPPDASSQQEVEMHGILYEDEIIRWLNELPKPIGIMACNDIRGQQILNACREIDAAVPEEIAVIGVDNDDIICELSNPPLTSVEPDTWRIGFEAARKLDDMMQGAPCQHEKHFIPPKGIVTRHSTDVIAIEDPVVAQSLRFIRENALSGINVNDVLEHTQVSRTILDKRFKKVMGYSPKQEISRLQMKQVKRLLVETDYSLLTISEMTGFKHKEYLNQAFKKIHDITPGEYRCQHELK